MTRGRAPPRRRPGPGGATRDSGRTSLGLDRPTAEDREAAARTLDLLGLTDVADRPIEALSLGRGRLVEVGRALMAEPKLLLLDEPSSGLDRAETAELTETLEVVQRERGTAILLVEHDVEMVQRFGVAPLRARLRHAHRRGPDPRRDEPTRRCAARTWASRSRATTRRWPRHRGGRVSAAVEPARDPVLSLREVDAGYGPFRALFGVSFDVAEGEVVALLGANGAGKTTVARVCSGLLHPTAGSVWLDGDDVSRARPYEIARLGRDPRARGSLGVRDALGGGEPHALVPP